ncbi:MAG: hypothetical protein HQM10_02595 [Candidatus Riflebacteria bacterium]|nr:hypothetical protein [Candidatus Riflebacteria bacterium]
MKGIVVFFCFFCLFSIANRHSAFNDPGTFFHTEVGNRIIRTSQFPVTDEFTCSRAGSPWIAQQWLGECIMSVLYRIGGWDSQFSAAVILLSYIFAMMAISLLNSGVHVLLVLLIMCLALGATTHHFLIRPHLFTIFFTFIAAKIFLHSEKMHSLSYLFALIPVCMLWANLHGGVLSCFLSMLFLIILWRVFSIAGFKSPVSSNKDLTKGVLCLAACVAVCFLNPYGLELFKTWTNIMTNPAVGEKIIEHLPAYKLWWGWLSIAAGVLYLLAVVAVPLNKMRVIYLLPVVWFLLAIGRIRHAPIFATYAVVVLPHFYSDIAWVKWLGTKGFLTFKMNESPAKMKLSTVVPVIFFCICLILQYSGYEMPLAGRNWASPSGKIWPVEIISEMGKFSSKHADKKGVAVFNEMNFGGFLIHQVPGFKVFIDDRCELHGDILNDFDEAKTNHLLIKKWDEKYSFFYALTVPKSGYDNFFAGSSSWKKVAGCVAGNFYEKIY